ncbi:MAG: hypothetical protein H0W15_08090 [Gemmatimonadales bacterium]|nr:hypothetical protein [Gemmatimonadales bacterium]
MTHFRRPLMGGFAVCSLSVLISACSAVGFELPNYGFYGFAPRPDGAILAPALSTERMIRAEGDTTTLAEGSVELDTARWGKDEAWLLTRRMPIAGGTTIEDSVWYDRWSLKTLATWRRDASGDLRMTINRRAVEIERRTPNGRTARRKVLLPAEPYAMTGIDLIIATLPLQAGYSGSLPIVLENRPDEMRWMKFDVLRGEAMVSVHRGVVKFRPTWVVTTELDNVQRKYWVAGDDRTVMRRELPGPDGDRVRMVRGGRIPRVQLAPVEPLPLP